jgi:aspartate aminotransferase-like enzyme
MGIITETETLQTIDALENALASQGYKIKKGAGLKATRERFLKN